jgi:hypothetical protein
MTMADRAGFLVASESASGLRQFFGIANPCGDDISRARYLEEQARGRKGIACNNS